jgi:hypothetical protein
VDTLIFVGHIIEARGGHAKLGIPGRQELACAPADWPLRLFRGSLNVLISPEGYPRELTNRGIPPTIRFLDSSSFCPAFQIEQQLMQNNQLNPENTRVPKGGTAQVWRAVLHSEGRQIHCWVLRRIGSGLDRGLEIVSWEGIRQTYNLPEPGPWPATVYLFGEWTS